MIISAYAVPHPPLAVPEVGEGKEKVIFETINALEDISREIAKIKPQTIIFISPHMELFSDCFNIAGGTEAAGDFSRFGVSGVGCKTTLDTEVTSEISQIAFNEKFPVVKINNTVLDHGILVPMYYINKHYTDYKSVCVSLSGLDVNAHSKMGKILAAACSKKTVVIASGDLSHKLAETGPYGIAEEGAVFDREIMKYLSEAKFSALLSMPACLREKAAECGYGAFAVLSGCLDGLNVSASPLSYECPFGVGYGVVRFLAEDDYRALARKSLEHRVTTGKDLQLPSDISKELLSKKAGAFVSLHIEGQLRGCIGTISPSTDSIAQEIIQNAVSAGLYDPRFPPVHKDELPLLTYKVDILDEPEEITGVEFLDEKLYGVIVESGFKRGLLLPNLDGVNSVEEQLAIACQKAGINANEKYSLQRFKVTRYE